MDQVLPQVGTGGERQRELAQLGAREVTAERAGDMTDSRLD
jgi:hypothetical protein